MRRTGEEEERRRRAVKEGEGRRGKERGGEERGRGEGKRGEERSQRLNTSEGLVNKHRAITSIRNPRGDS